MVRLAKVALALLCYLADCAFRLWCWAARKPLPAKCVVIYYHSVPEEQRAAFARQLDILTRLTAPISSELVSKFQPGKRYSCVTFDDGFEDTIKVAIPELVKRKIPATVFVAAGYLGRDAGWWPSDKPERQLKIASAVEWKLVPTELIAIGSHTMTHPYLVKLSDEEAERELRESRLVLEEVMEREIATFSFPYGSFNKRLIALCRDAGYHRVFTTLPGDAFGTRDEFVVGRVGVEPTDWSIEFRLKVLGAYRWLPIAFKWKRRILSLAGIPRRRQIAAA